MSYRWHYRVDPPDASRAALHTRDCPTPGSHFDAEGKPGVGSIWECDCGKFWKMGKNMFAPGNRMWNRMGWLGIKWAKIRGRIK